MITKTMSLRRAAFQANDKLDTFIAAVGDRFELVEEEFEEQKTVFLDTFDWRLFRKNRLFKVEMGESKVRLILTDLRGVLLRHCFVERLPEFAADLQAGAFQDRVESIVKMRRLFPVLTLFSCGKRTRVINEARKTLARMLLERSQVEVADEGSGRKEVQRIYIDSVRGYPSEFESLLNLARSQSALEKLERDDLTEMLALFDREPATYSSKFSLELNPSLSACEAAQLIYANLLDTMKLNEPGVRKDWDSEFLHDFRVAIRRTRAALAQLKRVFPKEITKHYKREFSWLGSVTGPIRDLDVYLLKFERYSEFFSEGEREALLPMKIFLERHKKLEHVLLVRALDSTRYKRLISSWGSFLSDSPSEGKTADEPIRKLASERIWKVYRRIAKQANNIKRDPDSDALHRLRLECKKLRYLLEFFRSLYDTKEMKKLIKALKSLQDNLGEFNDYEVQMQKLAEFAKLMIAEDNPPPETLLMMGRLIEHLDEMQEQERTRIFDRLGNFSSAKARKGVRHLFKGPGKSGS